MRKIISLNGEVSKLERERWAALSAEEFYGGDLEIESEHDGQVRLDKSAAYPMSLTRLYSRNSSLGYRRRRPHIRNNEIGSRLIWFVRKGTLSIRRPDADWEVRGGQIGFTNSNVPFHAQAIGSERGEYESYQLLVPGPLFATHLDEADRISGALDVSGASGEIVSNILKLLAKHGSLIDRDATSLMSESLLMSILELIKDKADFRQHLRNPNEARVAQIRRFIVDNVDNSELAATDVAAHYGMSARNLIYVLKQGETSFSKILWETRLALACRLLSSDEALAVPISDIAHKAGFKSAAHFSRMFATEVGLTPSKYRKIHASGGTSR